MVIAITEKDTNMEKDKAGPQNESESENKVVVEEDDEEEEEEEEDLFNKRIDNSGCAKQHYALQVRFES